MAADAPNTAPPKRKRRWLQFSLRSMMIVVTLLSVWLGIVSARANRQRRAVERIKADGGTVAYDFQVKDDCDPAWPYPVGPPLIDPESHPPRPEWLCNLIGVDYFATVVSVSNWQPDASSIEELANLPKLQNLDIDARELTGLPFGALKQLGGLKILNIWNADTPAIDWDFLESLLGLQKLGLKGSAVDDGTLEHVKNLGQLKTLWLRYTVVTDDGLTCLRSLKQLEWLDIYEHYISSGGQYCTVMDSKGANITSNGLWELMQALPRIKISGMPRE